MTDTSHWRERQRQAVAAANRRRAKQVRRASDGVVFGSLREAAAAEGKTAPGIAWQARNTRRWEFVQEDPQ